MKCQLEPTYVSISRVASVLGPSMAKLHRQAVRGKIPTLRLTRGWRIDLAGTRRRLDQLAAPRSPEEGEVRHG